MAIQVTNKLGDCPPDDCVPSPCPPIVDCGAVLFECGGSLCTDSGFVQVLDRMTALVECAQQTRSPQCRLPVRWGDLSAAICDEIVFVPLSEDVGRCETSGEARVVVRRCSKDNPGEVRRVEQMLAQDRAIVAGVVSVGSWMRSKFGSSIVWDATVSW